jgi:hypothetical protein
MAADILIEPELHSEITIPSASASGLGLIGKNLMMTNGRRKHMMSI